TPRCAYPAAASSAESFPIVRVARRRNNIAEDLSCGGERTYPLLGLAAVRRRDYLSHRFAKTRDQDGFAGFTHLLDYRQASRLELRDGDFFHRHYGTIVDDHGQFLTDRLSAPLDFLVCRAMVCFLSEAG